MEVLVNSSTSVTVQWTPLVSCAQNIISYSLRYGEVKNRTVVKMVSGDSSGGMTTISGLTKETVYTVEVAAETSAGTGVYSELVMFQTPDSKIITTAMCIFHFYPIADVFLSLNGVVIPNHGYVNISDIGTDDAALLCHTTHPGIQQPGGEWFAPDETRLFGNGVQGFMRKRAPMVVRLNKLSATNQPEGIYKCSIKENEGDSTPRELYVGLYHTAGIKSLQ